MGICIRKEKRRKERCVVPRAQHHRRRWVRSEDGQALCGDRCTDTPAPGPRGLQAQGGPADVVSGGTRKEAGRQCGAE